MKEQLGTSRKEGASLLGLQWNKDCDIISVNFPSESTEPTKRGILSKVAKIIRSTGASVANHTGWQIPLP